MRLCTASLEGVGSAARGTTSGAVVGGASTIGVGVAAWPLGGMTGGAEVAVAGAVVAGTGGEGTLSATAGDATSDTTGGSCCGAGSSTEKRRHETRAPDATTANTSALAGSSQRCRAG